MSGAPTRPNRQVSRPIWPAYGQHLGEGCPHTRDGWRRISRERVTGIEPAFSAWEIVLAEPATWAFSRSTWSEYPCGPVGFGSCCLVPVSCGTDMARRGVPWAVGQKQLMFAGRSGGDVIEGRCRLRWHLGERRRVRRRSLFAGSLLTPATRAGLAEWQAEVSRVDRV